MLRRPCGKEQSYHRLVIMYWPCCLWQCQLPRKLASDRSQGGVCLRNAARLGASENQRASLPAAKGHNGTFRPLLWRSKSRRHPPPWCAYETGCSAIVSLLGCSRSLYMPHSLQVLQADIDLLHPPAELEARSHKLKRLVQSPNSFFMDVKCPGCFQMCASLNYDSISIIRRMSGCSQARCRRQGRGPAARQCVLCAGDCAATPVDVKVTAVATERKRLASLSGAAGLAAAASDLQSDTWPVICIFNVASPVNHAHIFTCNADCSRHCMFNRLC